MSEEIPVYIPGIPIRDNTWEIRFQFSTSKDVAPKAVPRTVRETKDGHEDRKDPRRPAGKEIIPITMATAFAEDLLADLHNDGWVLAEAFTQRRINYHAGSKPFYFTTVFRFGRASENESVAPEICAAFSEMVSDIMWRARGYENFLFHDGQKGFQISINCEVRTPLFEGGKSSGKPVMQWLHDENGQKIGDKPLPIKPKWELCVGVEGEREERHLCLCLEPWIDPDNP
ncbi:MAG: hypothetical protein WC797_02270 [Candidatus Paceibacterota bacterium]|jgi:hypothetical protein